MTDKEDFIVGSSPEGQKVIEAFGGEVPREITREQLGCILEGKSLPPRLTLR